MFNAIVAAASTEEHGYDLNSLGGMIKSVSDWVQGHVNPNFSLDPSEWSGLDHTFTATMVGVVTVLMLIIFLGIYDKKQKVPTGITNFLESFVMFVRNEIAIKNMGQKDGRAWSGFFCTMFFFVLGMNLLGLVPMLGTATGTPFVTVGLAGITFFCMTVVTIVKFGPVKFVKAFAPAGVPGPILVILWPLEVFGLLVKSASLAIRLFANMLAGHIVLFSILALLYVFKWWAAPAFFIGVGIYALEVFVAFLQAYIFTFLSAMFIGEVFHHAEGHDHHDDEQAHAH